MGLVTHGPEESCQELLELHAAHAIDVGDGLPGPRVGLALKDCLRHLLNAALMRLPFDRLVNEKLKLSGSKGLASVPGGFKHKGQVLAVVGECGDIRFGPLLWRGTRRQPGILSDEAIP